MLWHTYTLALLAAPLAALAATSERWSVGYYKDTYCEKRGGYLGRWSKTGCINLDNYTYDIKALQFEFDMGRCGYSIMVFENLDCKTKSGSGTRQVRSGECASVYDTVGKDDAKWLSYYILANPCG